MPSLKQRTQTQDFYNPLDVLLVHGDTRSKGNSVVLDEDKTRVQRQNSMASSFQNLSLNDAMSVNDSQHSHYNPSINEPFISADADLLEKEMHAFLDHCGIFQVNLRQQLESEKRSTHTASSVRRSMFQTRKSPSFLERRTMRLA